MRFHGPSADLALLLASALLSVRAFLPEALVAQGAVDRLVRVLGHRLGLRCPGDAGSDAGSAPGTPVGSGERGGLLRQSLSSGSLRGSAGFASWMAPDAFCPGQPDPVSLSLLRLLHRVGSFLCGLVLRGINLLSISLRYFPPPL